MPQECCLPEWLIGTKWIFDGMVGKGYEKNHVVMWTWKK